MHEDGLVRRFETVKSLVREAGELARRHFENRESLVVESKTVGEYETVSEADRAVEEMIRENLGERFPTDGFLGEETGASSGSKEASPIWVVDPIDGTDCFVNGIPVWCVSIALVVGGEIELGAVYDPNAGELFAARRGHGAYLGRQAIHASRVPTLADGVVGVGISHRVRPQPTLGIMERLLEAGGMYQRNGSGALMLCYVAAGRLIGYYEPHINSWDALAGIVLVREAGGWVNDFLADDGLMSGNPVLACGPNLVGPMRDLCRLDPPARLD